MGESKRRKKIDPNYGSKQLEVKLKPEVILPYELAELKKILEREGKKWAAGEVIMKGVVYPVIFMPYTKYYQGRLKLYSQVGFAPENRPKLSQKLIDRISQEACRQLRDKYK